MYHLCISARPNTHKCNSKIKCSLFLANMDSTLTEAPVEGPVKGEFKVMKPILLCIFVANCSTASNIIISYNTSKNTNIMYCLPIRDLMVLCRKR